MKAFRLISGRFFRLTAKNAKAVMAPDTQRTQRKNYLSLTKSSLAKITVPLLWQVNPLIIPATAPEINSG